MNAVTVAQIFEHLGGPLLSPVNQVALRSVIRHVLAGGTGGVGVELQRAIVGAKQDLERPARERTGRRRA
jgi:hypothetical protein